MRLLSIFAAPSIYLCRLDAAYSDDNLCRTRFTQGQVDRMKTQFEIYRFKERTTNPTPVASGPTAVPTLLIIPAGKLYHPAVPTTDPQLLRQILSCCIHELCWITCELGAFPFTCAYSYYHTGSESNYFFHLMLPVRPLGLQLLFVLSQQHL
jgi:hypothetical protein